MEAVKKMAGVEKANVRFPLVTPIPHPSCSLELRIWSLNGPETPHPPHSIVPLQAKAFTHFKDLYLGLFLGFWLS